jgi:AcrR family transcriptional regulator
MATAPARARRARPRPAYHHGDLREALLDGARSLLRERGPEALSLREVARRVGVSHAAPYHHFASREALLAALAGQAFEALDRTMAEAQAAAPAEPGPQLVAVGMGYVLFALREPALFRLMIRPEFLAPRREQPPGPEAACLGPYGRLQEAVGRLQGRPADEESLHLCWGAVHGLALLLLDGALGLPPGAVAGHARAVIGRLVDGLARPGVR